MILRAELEELAPRRGVEVHYVLGDHRGPGAQELLSAAHLGRLVPDIAHARRLRLRTAGDGRRDRREPAPRRRPAPPGDHGALRALMRMRAVLAALVVTAVVVVLLVSYDTRPPRAPTRSRRCARPAPRARDAARRGRTRPAR